MMARIEDGARGANTALAGCYFATSYIGKVKKDFQTTFGHPLVPRV